MLESESKLRQCFLHVRLRSGSFEIPVSSAQLYRSFYVICSLPVLSSQFLAATSTMLGRRATLNDTEQVTDVFLASMPYDPSWPSYRFPYRLEYAEDHRKYNGDLIRRFISPDHEDWVVMVINAEDPALESTKIVAFSTWDLTYLNKRKHGPSCEPRLRKLHPTISVDAQIGSLSN